MTAYRANNQIKYVILVGGDATIPFFRYPDQNTLGPGERLHPAGRQDPGVGGEPALGFVLPATSTARA